MVYPKDLNVQEKKQKTYIDGYLEVLKRYKKIYGRRV